MTIAEKLALMKEMNRRNDERWSISNEEQHNRQVGTEYSIREEMLNLYIIR